MGNNIDALIEQAIFGADESVREKNRRKNCRRMNQNPSPVKRKKPINPKKSNQIKNRATKQQMINPMIPKN